MNRLRTYHLAVIGCGTVGVAVTRELTHAPTAPGIGCLTLVDGADIREVNAITCPEYAGHAGRPKSLRLAELGAEWLQRNLPIRWLRAKVEALPWEQVIASPSAGDRGTLTVVIIGLDDWDSRLIVVEELRRFAPLAGGPVLAIQCGLDRDQAQVAVFGTSWDDPCPACGLSLLPSTEPCVALDAEGRLLRGALRREAHAAAALVAEIVAACLNGPHGLQAWVNTKTSLLAKPPGSDTFLRSTHLGRHQPLCLGPHSPNGPLRWDPASVALRRAGAGRKEESNVISG